MSDMSNQSSFDAALQEIAAPRQESHKGRYVALAFFVGLLGWAALTPLDSGAVAQGLVAVAGNRQVVQHREGGIVTALNVVEGQSVKQGDILVKISESELLASERGMAGQVLTLLAQRQRLRAERDGAGHVADPEEYKTVGKEDRAMADEAMRGQRLLFTARRSALNSQQSVLNQRVLQTGSQISAYEHQIASNREQQRLMGEELAGLKALEDRGFVAKNRVRAMERGAAELDGNFGALNADISRSGEAIGESRMQMVTLQKQMMEDVATQLRDVQLQLSDMQPKWVAAREQLARSFVRATASGRVVGLKVHTVGGVVGAGETLMEIVPQNRALVIEAKAAPNDADDLKLGMQAQIRFSALQERNLPMLFGKISKISADSLEDARTGMRYFEIEVLVPPSEIDKIKKVRSDAGIRAGLPADVLIPLRKRTALDYLTEPLTQMFWRAGREH